MKVYTQINDTSNVIIDFIQEPPVFPGGPDKIWCFLESNFKYDILNANQQPVKYLIGFFIDSSGMARGFRFIDTKPSNINNDHSDSLKRNEILRVLTLMPKWELPREFNKKIKYWVAIPNKTPYIDFKCKKENKNNSH